MRNEAKERQKSNLKQFQTTDNQCSTVDLNSGRRDEDMTQRTDRKLAEKAGVSHDTIHKTRYVMEKADKELLEQKRKPIGEKSVLLNSGEQNEDMTQRTDRKLAKNMGKLSSESFRLLKICRHYMQ